MSVFAREFTLLDLHHRRRETAPNPNRLTVQVNKSWDAEPLGRFTLQVFFDRDAKRLYARLYHWATGEAAWFDIDDEKAAVVAGRADGGGE